MENLEPVVVEFYYCSSQEPDYYNLIDVGAFFDRFNGAKLQVLTSTDPVVKALLMDVSVRKWIDLRRPDVEQALNIIATKCDLVTPELIQAILHRPVDNLENLSLRKLYFGA